MHKRHFALAALLLLGACTFPSRIDFKTDPRIFRGGYETTLDLRKASDMVALSEDASRLVMGSSSLQETQTQLWDVNAQKSIKGALGKSTDTTGVAITRDGKLVALSFRGGVALWNVADNTLRAQLAVTSPECPDCGGGKLAFSADGTLLAVHSGGGRPEKLLSVFDTATGERLLLLHGPEGDFEGAEVRFSPDDTVLAFVSQNDEYRGESGSRSSFQKLSRVALWSLPSGEPFGSFVKDAGSSPQVDAHAWDEAAPIIGVVKERSLELLNSVTGEVLRTLPLETRVEPRALYLSPDNRLAAFQYGPETFSATPTGTLIVWELGDKDGTERILSRAENLQPLGFSTDSASLLTYSEEGVALRDPETLQSSKLLVTGAVTKLRLDVDPTLIDASRYTVGGTLTFGDDAPTPITGEASGGDTELYIATSPTLTPSLSFTFEHEGRTWGFNGAPVRGGARGLRWYGFLAPTEVAVSAYETELIPVTP